MLLASTLRAPVRRRSAFTLMEVLVVVAILVILAGVAIIAVPTYLENAKKSKAHLTAKSLAQACEAYKLHSANPTQDYPTDLRQLLAPFNNSPSLLVNGEQDLVDPWQQPFTLEVRNNSQGAQYIYIHTQAKGDNTPISNFGVGANSEPKMQ